MNHTLENQVLTLLLTQGSEGKLWTESEITKGLGLNFPVSICVLEQLQAAGKIKLTLDHNFTYLCQFGNGNSNGAPA
jgi:hypothetical protein